MAQRSVSRHAPDATELSTARALRIVWRGARLHCPNCGGGGILDGWFKLKHRCPTCGLVLDRGESDYFLGAYTVNLVVVELLVTGILVAVGVATAPNVPWTLLTWGGAALALVVAIGCYPLTKVLWLAFDLILRPVTVEELALGRQETGTISPTRSE
jgi:uncharacterized protein (DUF983 family)